MQQDKALKILSQQRQSLSDKYGVKKIGVFPHKADNLANCKCECGNCCGYHPQIGVAVEYKPEVRPGLDFVGLKLHIEDLFGCEISLARIGGRREPFYEKTDNFMKDIVYVR